VLLRGGFRHQQKNHEGDGLLIGGIKANRVEQLKHRCHGRLEAFDAAMGDGHAITQAGRPQALARKQAVGHQRTADAMGLFKQQTGFFKCPLLAGGVDGNQHLFGGQNGSEAIHGLRIMHGLTRRARGFPEVIVARV
jgi:hypothetical protein